MSNDGFEFFEGTTSTSSTTPRVTVRRAGQLILTQAAVDLLGDGVTHVQLGYNPKTKAVGIRPAAGLGKRSARVPRRISRLPGAAAIPTFFVRRCRTERDCLDQTRPESTLRAADLHSDRLALALELEDDARVRELPPGGVDEEGSVGSRLQLDGALGHL